MSAITASAISVVAAAKAWPIILLVLLRISDSCCVSLTTPNSDVRQNNDSSNHTDATHPD
jgi:hypothetical protein